MSLTHFAAGTIRAGNSAAISFLKDRQGASVETLRGTVSKLASTRYDIPTLKSRQRRTVYTERFEIGGRKIRFESAMPPKSQAINEGDEMMLAGAVKNGIFNALAMKNLTTGVASHQSFFLMLLGALIFSVVGIFVLVQYASQFLEGGLIGLAILAVFPGIFFLFGGLLLYAGHTTLQAVVALRKASKSPIARGNFPGGSG
jgi:hypothetical protein